MSITDINIGLVYIWWLIFGGQENYFDKQKNKLSDVNNTYINIMLSLSPDVQSNFLHKLNQADRKSLAETFHQNDDA